MGGPKKKNSVIDSKENWVLYHLMGGQLCGWVVPRKKNGSEFVSNQIRYYFILDG